MENAILAALSSLISKKAKACPPLEAGARVEFDEVVTLRLKGILEKGQDEMFTPTPSFPTKLMMAAFMMRSGCLREANIEMAVETMLYAYDNGTSTSEAWKRNLKDAEEAMRIVEERILARLPKQRRTGKTKVTGTVEEV